MKKLLIIIFATFINFSFAQDSGEVKALKEEIEYWETKFSFNDYILEMDKRRIYYELRGAGQPYSITSLGNRKYRVKYIIIVTGRSEITEVNYSSILRRKPDYESFKSSEIADLNNQIKGQKQQEAKTRASVAARNQYLKKQQSAIANNQFKITSIRDSVFDVVARTYENIFKPLNKIKLINDQLNKGVIDDYISFFTKISVERDRSSNENKYYIYGYDFSRKSYKNNFSNNSLKDRNDETVLKAYYDSFGNTEYNFYTMLEEFLTDDIIEAINNHFVENNSRFDTISGKLYPSDNITAKEFKIGKSSFKETRAYVLPYFSDRYRTAEVKRFTFYLFKDNYEWIESLYDFHSLILNDKTWVNMIKRYNETFKNYDEEYQRIVYPNLLEKIVKYYKKGSYPDYDHTKSDDYEKYSDDIFTNSELTKFISGIGGSNYGRGSWHDKPFGSILQWFTNEYGLAGYHKLKYKFKYPTQLSSLDDEIEFQTHFINKVKSFNYLNDDFSLNDKYYNDIKKLEMLNKRIGKVQNLFQWFYLCRVYYGTYDSGFKDFITASYKYDSSGKPKKKESKGFDKQINLILNDKELKFIKNVLSKPFFSIPSKAQEYLTIYPKGSQGEMDIDDVIPLKTEPNNTEDFKNIFNYLFNHEDLLEIDILKFHEAIKSVSS